MRAGSATARTLFIGILERGSRRTFEAKAIWVRFGAAERVEATLAGKPVAIPAGTVNVIVTAGGLHAP